MMEFVEAGVVMIKGKATGQYIAMSANGELYITVSTEELPALELDCLEDNSYRNDRLETQKQYH